MEVNVLIQSSTSLQSMWFKLPCSESEVRMKLEVLPNNSFSILEVDAPFFVSNRERSSLRRLNELAKRAKESYA